MTASLWTVSTVRGAPTGTQTVTLWSAASGRSVWPKLGTKRTARVRVSGFSSGTMARTEASCGLPSSRVRTTLAPGVSPTMRW